MKVLFLTLRNPRGYYNREIGFITELGAEYVKAKRQSPAR